MIDPKEFAKELRIGNWLNPEEEEFKGKYFQIDAGDIKHIREGMQRYKYEPIPLSSEILIACGFEPDNRGWEQKDQFFLQIREHGRWVNDKPIQPVKYMAYKSGVGAITEVTSLHQLQNLFFAVMSTELQYNPKQ